MGTRTLVLNFNAVRVTYRDGGGDFIKELHIFDSIFLVAEGWVRRWWTEIEKEAVKIDGSQSKLMALSQN